MGVGWGGTRRGGERGKGGEQEGRRVRGNGRWATAVRSANEQRQWPVQSGTVPFSQTSVVIHFGHAYRLYTPYAWDTRGPCLPPPVFPLGMGECLHCVCAAVRATFAATTPGTSRCLPPPQMAPENSKRF